LQKSSQKVSLLQDTFAKPRSLGKRSLEKLSQNLRVLQTTFRNQAHACQFPHCRAA
jgi:hypothetical protein